MVKVTHFLLLTLGFIFLLQMVFPFIENLFIFVPSLAFSEPWRFITSMFLHADLTHLFFNCYALFMFGSILESRVTKTQFLSIYFLAGLAGGLLYLLTIYLGIIDANSALGASGAIYGILGAVAILLPELTIFMWFFPVKMKYAAILWALIEFLGSFNRYSGVGSAAHLGGLIVGALIALYIKNQKPSGFGFVSNSPPNDPWEAHLKN